MKTGPSKKFILEACKWDIDNEKIALRKCEQQLHVTISRCGLFINPKCPRLQKQPP